MKTRSDSAEAFMIYLSISLAFATLAACIVVFIEPVSAGSGIPEIKSVLNGVTVKRSMRIRTLISKAIGIVCSTAGNLPVGKAGTMIHCGAICGAGLSQGKSTTMGFDTSFSKFKDFRNDREKRDFIACGAAAGIAAAFGSPLGGIMFCLEEGSSHWTPSMTWRTIFSAMIAAFVFDVFSAGIHEGTPWGSLSNPGILAFGNATGDEHYYRIWELPFFLILGVVGGIFGAAFNGINSLLHRLRERYIQSRRSKITEVMAISLCISAVSFWLPRVFYPALCVKKERDGCPGDISNVEKYMIQFYCPDGQYDELATLYLNSAERAIKYLFHTPSTQPFQSSCNFRPSALALFVVPYTLLSCWTFSAFVPAGIFIPSILTGAATGRLYGHMVTGLMESISGTKTKHAAHGMYSLLGAAAMLSGNLRLIISITVIFIETTGDAQCALPVFLTALAARWVANLLNSGIFDMTILIRNIPFLRWRPPAWYGKLTAADVMSTRVVSLREMESAGNILDILQSNRHHAFPVLSPPGGRRRRPVGGSRGRSSISIGSPDIDTSAGRRSLTLEDIEGSYPRYLEAKNIQLSQSERNMLLDLSPIYDPTPHVVRPIASLLHVYQIFRQLGLRHLLVSKCDGQPLGLITRQDLTEEHAKQCLHRVRGRSQFSISNYEPHVL
eukprot:jgi/Bigna1/39679/e_gw1.34.77.1